MRQRGLIRRCYCVRMLELEITHYRERQGKHGTHPQDNQMVERREQSTGIQSRDEKKTEESTPSLFPAAASERKTQQPPPRNPKIPSNAAAWPAIT